MDRIDSMQFYSVALPKPLLWAGSLVYPLASALVHFGILGAHDSLHYKLNYFLFCW